MNAVIAAKEVEHEETKKAYNSLVQANLKFLEYSSKFREMYVRVDDLEKAKLRLEADLADAKLNLQEIDGWL